MQKFFSYWLWPNPAEWHYGDYKIQVLLGVCVSLVIGSFLIGYWRRSLKNPITRKLSSSWASTAFWFGIIGCVLVISRVEMIQFLAMRVLWAVWFFLLLIFVLFQFVQFRRRHYTVMERVQVTDERDKYLPRKK